MSTRQRPCQEAATHVSGVVISLFAGWPRRQPELPNHTESPLRATAVATPPSMHTHTHTYTRRRCRTSLEPVQRPRSEQDDAVEDLAAAAERVQLEVDKVHFHL